ncbi:unnamed protein product [Ectocarpus sp. 12 AP-2014]
MGACEVLQPLRDGERGDRAEQHHAARAPPDGAVGQEIIFFFFSKTKNCLAEEKIKRKKRLQQQRERARNEVVEHQHNYVVVDVFRSQASVNPRLPVSSFSPSSTSPSSNMIAVIIPNDSWSRNETIQV